jgi:hypothetical protein
MSRTVLGLTPKCLEIRTLRPHIGFDPSKQDERRPERKNISSAVFAVRTDFLLVGLSLSLSCSMFNATDILWSPSKSTTSDNYLLVSKFWIRFLKIVNGDGPFHGYTRILRKKMQRYPLEAHTDKMECPVDEPCSLLGNLEGATIIPEIFKFQPSPLLIPSQHPQHRLFQRIGSGPHHNLAT